MIKKMEIKNFKCFEDFTIDNLAPITIIGGENNVGKSAILEAVLVQNIMRYTDYFKILMGLRNDGFTQNTLPSQIWNPLFFNMDDSQGFEIIYERIHPSGEGGEPATERSTFAISKIYDNSSLFQNDDRVFLTQNYQPASLKRIFSSVHAEYKSNSYQYAGRYVIQNGTILFQPDDEYTPSSASFFKSLLNPPLWPFEISFFYKTLSLIGGSVEWLSKTNLDEEKRALVVKTLQYFDENIIEVVPVIENGSSSIYVTLASRKHIPLNYMGDGLNKVFQLRLIILNIPNGIFLIDEIENGLYFESYEKILPVLCETALKMNCQLIMTTHNRNIIGTILSSMKEKGKLDSLCYQRIGFSKSKRKAFAFDGESLEAAFESNFEIR